MLINLLSECLTSVAVGERKWLPINTKGNRKYFAAHLNNPSIADYRVVATNGEGVEVERIA